MSMKITEDDVRHVAKLSRLDLDESEIGPFTEQLAKVLGYIDKINELDVEGVEPMAHPMNLTNVWREDVEASGLTAEAALSNAPQRDGDFFAVPKILPGEGPGA